MKKNLIIKDERTVCERCNDITPPCSLISIPIYDNNPKYSKFSNFLNNKAVSKETWPSCHKDIGALEVNENHEVWINPEKCIGCMACITSCPYYVMNLDNEKKIQLLEPIFGSYQNPIEVVKETQKYFSGERIELPRYLSLNRKLTSLEEFTSTKETEHIAIWALSTLKFLSSEPVPRVGKEIEIVQMSNPRDGRLDVCVLSNSELLVLETKVSLKDLLSENRYRIQISSYTKECKRILSEYNSKTKSKINLNIFLLIGGKETDLYPPGHPDCTSTVGNKAISFYKELVRNGIKFISANAIWALVVKSIASNKKICWDVLLPRIFQDKNSIGFLTAGIVKHTNGKFTVLPVPETYLNEAELAFSSQA